MGALLRSEQIPRDLHESLLIVAAGIDALAEQLPAELAKRNRLDDGEWQCESCEEWFDLNDESFLTGDDCRLCWKCYSQAAAQSRDANQGASDV